MNAPQKNWKEKPDPPVTTLDLNTTPKFWSFNPETGAVVFEASSVGWAPGFIPLTVDIVGAAQTVRFQYKAEDRRNGEVVAWHFFPVDYDGIAKVVTVLND